MRRAPIERTLNPSEQHVNTYLHDMNAVSGDLTTRGYAYRNAYDFLLRHGTWYHPRRLPKPIPRGAPKRCFANGILASVRYGLRYVEGYALSAYRGQLIPPVLHAWVIDARDQLYEVTWSTPGVAYLGVPFSTERADDATWRGDACVLDDYRRAYPILRQPWAGEPPVSFMTPTPMLALVAQGRWREALQWARTHVDDAPGE
jgi:hypothetical protein